MKKQLGLTCACLLAIARFAFADSINIIDASGDPTSGSYAPGSSFTLSMQVNATNPPETDLNGFSLWLAPGNAAWNNFFTITSKTVGDFPDSNNGLTAGGEGIVAGGTVHDLGYTNDVGVNFPSPSTKNGGTLTIQIGAGVAPGVYTIHTTVLADNSSKQTEMNDGSFVQHQVGSSVYTITVVPEPSTWSLLGVGSIGSLGLTWLRARRRS
jgi:hypothetical protein